MQDRNIRTRPANGAPFSLDGMPVQDLGTRPILTVAQELVLWGAVQLSAAPPRILGAVIGLTEAEASSDAFALIVARYHSALRKR